MEITVSLTQYTFTICSVNIKVFAYLLRVFKLSNLLNITMYKKHSLNFLFLIQTITVLFVTSLITLNSTEKLGETTVTGK